MIIQRAVSADIPRFLALINGAADRLHERGIDQWPEPFTRQRAAPLIAAGDVYLAVAGSEGGAAVAAVAVRDGGDPDFWRPAELATPSSYISRLARAEGFPGVGDLLLRWAVDAAAARGDRWVRLDAWRTNTALHGFYAARGWDHLRTVDVAGRKSGALFQRLALPTAHGFRTAPVLPGRAAAPPLPGVLPAGTEVVTGGWEHGVITEAHGPDWGYSGVGEEWEHDDGQPGVAYTVRFQGRTVILGEGAVTPVCLLPGAGRHHVRLAG